MEKRGISAIVATVLVILITIVAVTIIWAVIVPMINQSATFDDVNTRLDIIGSGGYTFYDSENEMLYVQVKRGIDDSNMVGVDVIVIIEGDSITFNYNEDNVPGPNGAKVLSINLTGLGVPNKIKVIPIINDGGDKKPSINVVESIVEIKTATEPMEATPVSCEDDGDCNIGGEICGDNSKCCTQNCNEDQSSACVGSKVIDSNNCKACDLDGTGISCASNQSSVLCGVPVTSTCENCGNMNGTICPTGTTCNGVNCVADGLVSYWPFDVDFSDVTGGYDGTPYGDAVIEDGVLKLDGFGDYIVVGGMGILSNDTYSVSVWFNCQNTNASDYDMIFSMSYPRQRILKGRGSSGVIFYDSSSTYNMSTGYTSYSLTPFYSWHHVVVTYDYPNQNASIYIDGNYIQGDPNGFLQAPSNVDYINIGTYTSTGYNFIGSIDNFMIYEKALNPAEVSDLFNAQRTGKL